MKRYQKLFLALVGLGLCATLYPNFQREQVENANKTIETVMEYNALVRIAQNEGVPKETVFNEFKKRGVTTLAVFDTSLDKLVQNGSITAITGTELLKQKNTGSLSPLWQQVIHRPDFTVDAVYLMAGTSERGLQEAAEDIRLRFGPSRIREMSTSPQIFQFTGDMISSKNAVAGDERGVREMDLGPSTDELEDVTKMGLWLPFVPRTIAPGIPQKLPVKKSRWRLFQTPGSKRGTYFPDLRQRQADAGQSGSAVACC